MTTAQWDIENLRLETERQELIRRLASLIDGGGILDIFPGMMVAGSKQQLPPHHAVSKPALCIIAQGRKRVVLGDETFTYDSGHYLLSTIDLPVTSCVIEATAQEPYLSFKFELDPSLVASVMLDAGIDLRSMEQNAKAINVSKLDADLLNAVVRILRLLDSPDDVAALLPMIQREIIFRLLKGDQGPRLAHLLSSGEDRRITKAVNILRKNFASQMNIGSLAKELGMSVSGFHQHFKNVTSMSPLQFQKQIRLQEARRLMLSEDLDAATAGFNVGYDDPSYFSRDYKNHFGRPPQRDIAAIRQTRL